MRHDRPFQLTVYLDSYFVVCEANCRRLRLIASRFVCLMLYRIWCHHANCAYRPHYHRSSSPHRTSALFCIMLSLSIIHMLCLKVMPAHPFPSIELPRLSELTDLATFSGVASCLYCLNITWINALVTAMDFSEIAGSRFEQVSFSILSSLYI